MAYRAEADLFKSANLMAALDDEERFQGFLGLMSHPKSKFSEITIHLLLEYLFDENNKLRASTTDALSRYLDLDHPEAGFYPPKEIREYVQIKLNSFGRNQIVNLLETAWLDEERLMQRGSLGQCAGVIISNIPNYEKHLSSIILQSEFKEEIRLAGIVLAEEFGMEMTILQIVYEFDKTDWGNIRDWVKERVEFYAEFVDTAIITIIENAVDNAAYDDDEIAYALRDAGTPVLVLSEYQISKIEDNTQNLTVKFYAQQAIHKIMRYKGQLSQDLLPGFENV
jgi:hypothetical protein